MAKEEATLEIKLKQQIAVLKYLLITADSVKDKQLHAQAQKELNEALDKQSISKI